MRIIELNGKKYEEIKEPSGKKIVVLDRGWVVVGDVKIENEMVYIYNASNIRKWGTINGLGEIAENGPTEKTVMDNQPQTSTHLRSVIMFIDCNESKW